ncbi:polysaccharide pyruvyl transferase family protein [Paenibacillus abyssi]|uniref:Polysaccharide pyruvyl transferase domain-containing protein n=1 Tax=Paenibacillus abyssi TaxID=1340531 RepID=A0A917CTR4_9BACL|nr:polysaccharide pyruvyl transferase family protein [Paenibacillus abyssi]GGF98566.1 hypothetical protein GCM10010916_14770 [Paenibacillus abyssi]
MTTVLLAGVPLSPNLGDGLIASTLNRIIRMKGNVEIIHFDLVQGRCKGGGSLSPMDESRAVSEHSNINRLNQGGIRKRLTPNWMRMAKSYWLHRRKDTLMQEQIRKAVAESDAVLIGGGHLLIDTYLTFPLSVRRVAVEAKRQRKPLHIVTVGARGPWSLPAKAWFLDVCRTAETISVRDHDSRKFLLSMDAGLETKTVVLSDPALYTPEAFPLAFAHRSKPERVGSSPQEVMPVVGLGIMDPHEMNRHSEYRWERDACASWWRDLAAHLVRQGFAVDFFTNGSATDNAFMEQYIKPCASNIERVYFRPYPTTVYGLVEQIADCDAVIAQRLHACIPSLSMFKPTYGLIWDRKLENIFKDLGLEANVIDFHIPAAQVAQRLDLSAPMPLGVRERLREKKAQINDYVGRIVV